MTFTLLLVAVAAFVVLAPLALGGTPAIGEIVRRVLIVVVVAVAVAVAGLDPKAAAPASLDIPATVAATAVAASLLLHLLAARTRTGALWLGLSLLAAVVVPAALATGLGDVAFVASLVSLALRAGRPGVVAIAERQPTLLVELGGSALAAIVVHLRFVVPAAATLAHDAAVPLVAWGAAATLLGGLLALAQRSLRGLWSSSSTMHAGMLFAAVGAAGRGHTVAAVLVGVTFALALGGFGFAVAALEARVGRVMLHGQGGRVRSFPTLAASFAFFAAAGVGLPGTAGFIADDLLLHALWEEGAVAAAVVVASSAMLAVALLRGYGAVFLGPVERTSHAPDLRGRERIVVAVAIVALLLIGVFPMILVGPASAVLLR